MRTRPGCQEAPSEPRWCRRCSLPASGLSGQVWARSSLALPAEHRPCSLRARQPLPSLAPGGRLAPTSGCGRQDSGCPLPKHGFNLSPYSWNFCQRSLECLQEKGKD